MAKSKSRRGRGRGIGPVDVHVGTATHRVEGLPGGSRARRWAAQQSPAGKEGHQRGQSGIWLQGLARSGPSASFNPSDQSRKRILHKKGPSAKPGRAWRECGSVRRQGKAPASRPRQGSERGRLYCRPAIGRERPATRHLTQCRPRPRRRRQSAAEKPRRNGAPDRTYQARRVSPWPVSLSAMTHFNPPSQEFA